MQRDLFRGLLVMMAGLLVCGAVGADQSIEEIGFYWRSEMMKMVEGVGESEEVEREMAMSVGQVIAKSGEVEAVITLYERVYAEEEERKKDALIVLMLEPRVAKRDDVCERLISYLPEEMRDHARAVRVIGLAHAKAFDKAGKLVGEIKDVRESDRAISVLATQLRFAGRDARAREWYEKIQDEQKRKQMIERLVRRYAGVDVGQYLEMEDDVSQFIVTMSMFFETVNLPWWAFDAFDEQKKISGKLIDRAMVDLKSLGEMERVCGMLILLQIGGEKMDKERAKMMLDEVNGIVEKQLEENELISEMVGLFTTPVLTRMGVRFGHELLIEKIKERVGHEDFRFWHAYSKGMIEMWGRGAYQNQKKIKAIYEQATNQTKRMGIVCGVVGAINAQKW
ncbi:hypothetical protein JD969_10135 [Planctomycetota bacterium]|nr:hypothetical protein JD969_10135 [Planctomycetota bacterium]